VSQSNIKAKKLAAFQFGLPSVDEQHEIVERVEQLLRGSSTFTARMQEATAAVERATPAILAKAFQGELAPHLRPSRLRTQSLQSPHFQTPAQTGERMTGPLVDPAHR